MRRSTITVTIIVCGALAVLGLDASAESTTNKPAPTEFQWFFHGVSTETNAAGKMVTKAITQETLLQEAAAAGGVTTKGLAVVYHVNGSTFGDTVDIINATNGVVLDNLLGYFFSSDASLGRASLTNGSGTEVQEIDYIYTSQNSHSLGASLTTKHYTMSHSNIVGTLIEGPIDWLVMPEGANGLKVRSGSFITGKPLF